MGKAETIISRNGQVDEKLLKPFTLGWTREVVKRVVAKKPDCDIYYFNPDGKKLRSLREVKAFLTDGLTSDCFSFKREIFGVDLKFETVRNAHVKRKPLQKKQRNETEIETKSQSDSSDVKKIKIETEKSGSEKEGQESAVENVEGGEGEVDTQRDTTQKANKRGKRNAHANVLISQREKDKETFKRAAFREMRQNRMLNREKHLWKPVKKVARPKNEVTKNTNKEGTELEIKSEKIPKMDEKETLSTSVESELQSKNAKIILRSRERLVPSTNMGTETKRKNNTSVKSKEIFVQSIETEAEGKRNEANLKRNETPVQSASAEAETRKTKEAEEMEVNQELRSADLKSIVQKNIGKYRKLREKQKLKLISAQKKKMSPRVVNKSRAESFLKNRSNYLKPLQKGWRRELVYRSNCSKGGLQADVYYFHPDGRKFRSSREILEYAEMTGGLSIEFFSFRKEAVGCGEPLEVIRKARTLHKTLI